LGGLTIAIILVCKKINKNIPGYLIGLITSAFLVAWFDLGAHGVKLVGDIPNHLPQFQLPQAFPFGRIFDLLGGATAIAIVGLVEAISISKSIALSSEQRINPNQEFLGQGKSNMIAAFFQCFPASGSFTRDQQLTMMPGPGRNLPVFYRESSLPSCSFFSHLMPNTFPMPAWPESLLWWLMVW